MDNASVKRRLTCILAADAVGYSKLMSEDEATTLRVLAAHRSVIDGVIAFHDGRIVSTAGDSVLAEFSSAVEAVRCAVEIQDALRTRNESLPENQRMLFRVGVNLGDVVVKGADLLGDGVNIAARLESIAPPGGIVISSSVYDQITGKLDLGFHDIGEQTLKNITHPVRAFAVSGAGGTVRVPAPARPRRSALPWVVAGSAVAIIAAGAGWKAGWFGATAPAPAPASVAATDPEREKLKAEVAAAEQARAAAEARANEAAAEAARTRAESEAAAMKSKAQSEAMAVKAKAEADAALLRSKSQAEAQAASDRTKAANDAAAKATSDAAAIRQKAEADAAPKVATASPAPQRADYSGAWTGRVVCDGIDDLSAGTFKVTVTASTDMIAIEWPVAGMGGNGHAEGRPSGDGSLTLRGSSISRSNRSLGKSIGVRFDGASTGRGFELRGHIGLRNCTLTLAQTG
jgi:adenylate cyclase